MGGAYVPYGRDEKFTQNFSGKTGGKSPVGITVRDETIITRGVHREIGCELITGFIWLRVMSIGGIL
jgi:hypothetical protein